jgi:hypothetical protein
MPFSSYGYAEATTTVKTIAAVTVPGEALWCEIQAEGNAIRYTLDGSTNPTATSGMRLLTTSAPTQLAIETVRNIRFRCEGTTTAILHFHWVVGRAIDDTGGDGEGDDLLLYEDGVLVETEDGLYLIELEDNRMIWEDGLFIELESGYFLERG